METPILRRQAGPDGDDVTGGVEGTLARRVVLGLEGGGGGGGGERGDNLIGR